MEEWYPTSIKLVAVLVGGKSVFYKYPGGTLPISIWLIVECWGGEGNISNGWVDEWGGVPNPYPTGCWFGVCVGGEVPYQYPIGFWLGGGR